MAPILFHGLSQLGLPVVCPEMAQCSPLLLNQRREETAPTPGGELMFDLVF
jgi:hypothetical protein